MSDFALACHQVGLSIKYGTTYFPFDPVELVRALTKIGFIPTEQMGPVPIGARVDVKGILGRKGDAVLSINTERYTLAINAPDPEYVLSEVESLESLLDEDLGFNSSGAVLYYELTAGFTLKAKKNVLESWSKHFTSMPIIEEFSEILGQPVAPFGLALVPTGEAPDQPNWFQIRLEPVLHSAELRHSIIVTCRNNDRGEVFGFGRSMDTTIQALLSAVEDG
ncbi:hypothetical protein J7J84_07345 [bacterium]|nr:hypothetical protein [bacterium]